MTNQPKPAPTAEEQLPELDEKYVEMTEDLGTEDGDSDVMVRLALDCRERQLLAALAERDAALRSNREKDAQLANFEDVLESMKELDKSRNPCGHLACYGFTNNGGKTGFCTLCELAEKDAKVAELVKDRKNHISLMAFREVLDALKIDREKLRAVSEALKTLELAVDGGFEPLILAAAERVTPDIRSIVDGKDSVPTSPQPPR